MTPEIIWALTREHLEREASATLLTAELEDPTGYGRVIRSEDGLVQRIIEENDADGDTLAIREINAGAYIFEPEALSWSLDRVGNENAQGEYYLTDTIDILQGAGHRVAAFTAAEDPEVVLGVNTVRQLMDAEVLLMERER